MRSFIPMMAHSGAFKNIENSISRYAQLIIYLLAIAFMGIFYIVVQKAFANYFETLLTNQPSYL